MDILVDRIKSDNDTTIGLMFINGKFECFVLEDEYRELKVDGETRIPEGYYELGIREVLSGKTKQYRAKYPSLFDWHLHLKDVPNFKYVYIHTGNTDDHSEGCLLVGDTCDLVGMTIGQSRHAYRRVYKKIRDTQKRGESVYIRMMDSDRA